MAKIVKSMFLPKSDGTLGPDLTRIQKQNYCLMEEGPIREVVEIFDKEEGLFPVLGGSLAAMSYSVGRTTKDCDINLKIGVQDFDIFYKVAQKYQFTTSLTAPVLDSVNQLPISSFSFKYNGFPFNIFFNDNFATHYAVENSKSSGGFRIIPPESCCFFKFASIKEDSKRSHKDLMDVENILYAVSSEEMDRINLYVSQSLISLWGSDDCIQLKLWKKCIEKVFKNKLDEDQQTNKE